jgi:hypothetical protein
VGSLHSEELRGSYGALGIVMVTKFRRLKWVAYVARMGNQGMNM